MITEPNCFWNYFQEWPRQTKPKKGQFMNFPQGHSGTKVQCESCLFSQGKPPEFTKKRAKFVNFSFWSFLWFGLPFGRLLILGFGKKKCKQRSTTLPKSFGNQIAGPKLFWNELNYSTKAKGVGLCERTCVSAF